MSRHRTENPDNLTGFMAIGAAQDRQTEVEKARLAYELAITTRDEAVLFALDRGATYRLLQDALGLARSTLIKINGKGTSK